MGDLFGAGFTKYMRADQFCFRCEQTFSRHHECLLKKRDFKSRRILMCLLCGFGLLAYIFQHINLNGKAPKRKYF